LFIDESTSATQSPRNMLLAKLLEYQDVAGEDPETNKKLLALALAFSAFIPKMEDAIVGKASAQDAYRAAVALLEG